MKQYYVDGKQISEEEARAIEAKNKEYMNCRDLSLLAKCQFIVVINKQNTKSNENEKHHHRSTV